jgi:predicted negative regulator of RcsB-dependent stress response
VAYDLEEQEKLDELKAWWGKYGNLVTAVIFLAAVSVLGVNGYNAWRLKKSGEAAQIYAQMEKAITAKDNGVVKETAATLMDKYARTAYAQMAALEVARVNADAGDLNGAAAQLQWAADHAVDDQYRYVARLRLASVQTDLNQTDAAIKTLSGDIPAQFQSAFADRRGDVLLAQNHIADARAQYQMALDHLDDVGKDLKVAYTNVEKLKLDALASATGSLASALPPATASAPPASASSQPVVAPAVASAPANPATSANAHTQTLESVQK